MTEQAKPKTPFPARRRLIIAVVIWFLIIRTLVLLASDAFGIPNGWAMAIC